MNMSNNSSKSLVGILAAALLIIAGSACTGAQPTPLATPAPVTQVVTRVVVQEITREVTRVVEIPVTMTPGPTEAPTSTPDPNATQVPAIPQATLPETTDCLYGPGTFFVYKTSFPAGQPVEVVGRSQDGNWLNIENVGGWNSCWIQAAQAQLQGSRIEDLPVVSPLLPRSEYEFGSPQTTTTKRDGDQVTVSWEAVYMSADEIQGYLIEARVCQGGQLIDLPVFLPVAFQANNGTLSVQITDEAGCSAPSTAHIASMGTRGFAEWDKIFWPPHP